MLLFHRHVQNAMIPCHFQELHPFLSVIYFFLPLFSPTTNLPGKEMFQLDATHMKFIRVLYLNMFWASICPPSGEQCNELPHMKYNTAIAGCG
jgi:hypothetical protein